MSTVAAAGAGTVTQGAVEYLSLGAGGPQVSRIGLGCMGMSEFYGPAGESNSLRTVHRALELGVNFFDTADVYGQGRNEELLGRALRGRRRKAVIATKFGILRDAQGRFVGRCGQTGYVRRCCEASLRRLGVERIDLYYCHRLDPATPLEETVGAMADLISAGKVGRLGLSEVDAEELRRACAVHPIAAVQSEYSLFARTPESGILEACRAAGALFVAYSPLGRGLLTGSIRRRSDLAADDWRLGAPEFQADSLRRSRAALDRLEIMAARKGCTPAQLALAWLLGRDPRIVPIPGARRPERLDEDLAALSLGLDAEERAALDNLRPAGQGQE